MPAILTNSESEFISQIKNLSPFFKYFQIDITDGKFVPSTTLTIDEVASACKKIDADLMKKLSFDFDLMVVDYKAAINSLLSLRNIAEIGNIFIHYASLKHEQLPNPHELTIGLALDPTDTVDDLDRYYNIKAIPCIQIMTVTPGFQGSPFLEIELNKIEQLRHLGYKNNIFIDGGVNNVTIPKILSHTYQPDYAGIGSFLSKATDIKQRVDLINNMIR